MDIMKVDHSFAFISCHTYLTQINRLKSSCIVPSDYLTFQQQYTAPAIMSTQFGFSKRIYKEMEELLSDTSLVRINDVTQPEGDDGRLWHVTFDGPAGGPYEGGKFCVEVKFGDSYPRDPPRLKLLTPIFHCNIHPQWASYYVEGGSGNYEPGSVCMNTLDKGKGWSVISPVKILFDELAALLASPNDEDPLNFLAAEMYRKDKEEYYGHAKDFTRLFAKPDTSEHHRQYFTMRMAIYLKEGGVPSMYQGISSAVTILRDCEVQYNTNKFFEYVNQRLMPANTRFQRGVDSHGGQRSSNQESEGGSSNGPNEGNNEIEGGTNNESDDDVVYLGTVRPNDTAMN